VAGVAGGLSAARSTTPTSPAYRAAFPIQVGSQACQSKPSTKAPRDNTLRVVVVSPAAALCSSDELLCQCTFEVGYNPAK